MARCLLRRPSTIAATSAVTPADIWTTVQPARFFGFEEYHPRGYPIRVTTPERTLLDGLQAPERSGGMANVLHAWSYARYTLNVKKLIELVDQLDITLLAPTALEHFGFDMDDLSFYGKYLFEQCAADVTRCADELRLKFNRAFSAAFQ